MQSIFTLLESILKASAGLSFIFHIIMMGVVGYLFTVIFEFKR